MRVEDSKSTALGCMAVMLLPVLIVWHSYVLTKLWTWFVVSHFGAKPLSMPVAYGLCLIGNMIVSRRSKDDDETATLALVQSAVFAALLPATTLALGWIAQGFL